MSNFLKSVKSFGRKNKKYLIAVGSFLLLCLLVFGMITVYHKIKTSINTPGLIFELDSETDTYVVTGYEGSSQSLVITGKYEGKKVSSIATQAFSERDDIVSVTVNGVETIGSAAFAGCPSLVYASLPGVKTVSSLAFSKCEALVSVENMDDVERIGASAFHNCSSLVKVEMPKTLKEIPNYCFTACQKLSGFTFPSGLERIGYRAFEQCLGLKNVVLPDGLKEIGDYAFSSARIYQPALASIKIPDSVETLGIGAFMYCVNLEKATLPANLTKISEYLFAECSALTSIVIPNSVKEIGDYAFNRCTSLQLITLPEKIEKLGKSAFGKNPWIDRYVGEDGFLIVSDCLIGYYGDKTDIVLPTTGYTIAADILSDNDKDYFSVTIPSGSCKELAPQAIQGNGRLKSIIIEEGVETLGDEAFYFNINLEYVVLPKSLKTMGSGIFSYCDMNDDHDLPVIYYAGTRSEWKEVVKGEENGVLQQMKVVCNSTGPESAAD